MKLVVEVTRALKRVLNQCKATKVRSLTLLADSKGQSGSYDRLRFSITPLVQKLQAEGLIAEKLTPHDLRKKARSDSPNDSRLLGHAIGSKIDAVYMAKPLTVRPVK